MPSLATVLPKRQVYTLVALGAVLLLLGTGTYHQRDLLPGAALARKARRPSANKCLDYNSPGYIFRGANHEPKEIRWIPYSEQDLASTEYVDLLNVTSPPPEKLASAPPSFNDWIKSAVDLKQAPELDFARGKTILTVGDSHDRRNVEGFCAQHKEAGAQFFSKGGHVASRCVIPDLNLTLASWFHYGLAEAKETWYMSNLPVETNPPPYSVEERMDPVFMPDLLDIGQPSLIILQSIYWDLRYVAYKAEQEGWMRELQRATRPMMWRELEWHRMRLKAYVKVFQERFPGVPIMFRLGQSRANNAQSGNIALYQMNESAKTLMEYLGVPIFPWAELLTGEEDYVDVMHVKPLSQPTYLFSDMVLYYLRRAVNGWETTC